MSTSSSDIFDIFQSQVQNDSPGSKAGLEAFFDFIVAIENTRLDQDNDTLKELLKAKKETEITMTGKHKTELSTAANAMDDVYSFLKFTAARPKM